MIPYFPNTYPITAGCRTAGVHRHRCRRRCRRGSAARRRCLVVATGASIGRSAAADARATFDVARPGAAQLRRAPGGSRTLQQKSTQRKVGKTVRITAAVAGAADTAVGIAAAHVPCFCLQLFGVCVCVCMPRMFSVTRGVTRTEHRYQQANTVTKSQKQQPFEQHPHAGEDADGGAMSTMLRTQYHRTSRKAANCNTA